MIQTRFDRRNVPCDDFIIIFTFLVACSTFLLSFCYDIPEGLEELVNLLVCCVNGCMLTQQEVELRYIQDQGVVYAGPTSHVLQMLPPNVRRVLLAEAPRQQQMAVVGTPVTGDEVMEAPPTPQRM